MSAIIVEDLFYGYPDKPGVIDGINLAVNSKENLGIIGPNGAGKTTLFHLLCGVLKPDKGSIKINNNEIISGRFNPDIGYVFQNPDDQLFNICVYDDVAFGPVNLGYTEKEVEEYVEMAARATGITDYISRSPHHLSGGEKRMASIASVISMKPDVLIYDEPSSNLDMRARRRLIDFIQKSDKTQLIASHDLEFILDTCDKVIIIDNGRIKAHDRPAGVMADTNLMHKHGLEVPGSILYAKR